RLMTCLSEASWSSDPAGGWKMWEPRSGGGTCGRLFLVSFFGEAKKSDRLSGRPRQASTKHNPFQ
ncbi:hypothetical protein ACVBEF_18305, partial [Glaciimonas sp. GG7]